MSLHEGGNGVRIVELKSSGVQSPVSSCHGKAVISGTITFPNMIFSAEQMERDLQVWNSMNSFVLGFQDVHLERKDSKTVQYCLLGQYRGSFPASVSRAPEEMYYHLENTMRSHSKSFCPSFGLSDIVMDCDDSFSPHWRALACIVATSQQCEGSSSHGQDTHVETISVFNSASQSVHSDIVLILAKCGWSKKGGFTFRSRSGSLPISIIRHGRGSNGSACSAHICRILLYIFPTQVADAGANSKVSSRKKHSMKNIILSALNNAIQQLKVNMDTLQPLWVDSSKPGIEAINTLVESLTGVLYRAHDASPASRSFLRAIKDMGGGSIQDVQIKLRDKVMRLQT